MITEQLIEDLNLPDFDKWVENIWCDDYWWDYIVHDRINEWSEKGIRIHTYSKYNNPHIIFDIYGRQCATDGMVDYDGKFYESYKDRLIDASPVYAQMFYEGYIGVSWKASRNGWLEVSASEEYNIDEDDKFTSGLFAGTSVRELMESETVTFVEFEECITEIIHELHKKLLNDLTSAYEYDTSEERYKEWILEQIYDAL
jgi:hypothetical protein